VSQTIRIPYNFNPRSYQLRFLNAFDRGFKRFVGVLHRRAGKDKTFLNMMVKGMLQRVGVYWYLAPTYTHGKKIIWDGIGSDGFKFIDHVPKALIAGKNDQEMKITLRNNSILQVIGTDKIGDGIVGPNPVGVVFSEFSLMDPTAYNLIRPILRENRGWMAFAYTPRGKNHGYKLYQTAIKYPETWYTELLTINDTRRDGEGEDGTPVLTEQDIEEERREGVDEELIQQEYYCSWEGYLQGSYYGKILQQLEKKGQVGNYPWIPELPVDTWWDIGQSDATAIWFSQSHAGEAVHFIDYLEESGEGLPTYAKWLKEKPYVYGRHFFPWDMEVKDWVTGEARKDTAYRLGIRPQQIAPKRGVQEGIDACRKVLPFCYFDRGQCERGLFALGAYHKEWDEKMACFRASPVHDWSSHGADGFRTFGIMNRRRSKGSIRASAERAASMQAIMEYDPFVH
jgi:hypothetical protein